MSFRVKRQSRLFRGGWWPACVPDLAPSELSFSGTMALTYAFRSSRTLLPCPHFSCS